MKKSILLIGMALLSIGSLSAQESVYFGVKGGLNLSTFRGDGFGDFDNPSSRTSFNLGLLAEIPLSDKFSVQPEVLYSGQGYDIASRNNANDVEYQLDYINVPVLAKYYLIEGLSIEAGPQIGFLVNSEIDSNPSGDGGDVALNEDQFNKVDLSLGLGASYKFRGGFFVNARYNFGLSDVYDDSYVGFKNSDVKHSVFQGGIGFMF
ncbi:opacity protein-like surface antigen [Gillisia sp. Hel_I_86]|uniref:porin family protein n=1 Tax=Gillisia sp. Hel_I_86 TaxID=1249981 RepID=UPI00119994DC|nr:porin family protein [Gillisia sp. Hel_I_86]TVZ28178.1 opacity protein-like surface antigen [Gillisia sp. Hel_I_86]